MANYAIGDVQGCYDALCRLLDHINFDEQTDYLWFVGDLVNRGPDSLAVINFIMQLPLTPRVCLGNHDLYLLARLCNINTWKDQQDTLENIIQSPNAANIQQWLRHQALLHYDKDLNIVMTHAGIPPSWDLHTAICCAKELEHALQAETYMTILAELYGNQPSQWSAQLQGIDRLRFICNGLTRMRFVDAQGGLHFESMPNQKSNILTPWFSSPKRHILPVQLVFGHWAALQGHCPIPNIAAIDTGCLWGGSLTALRLEDQQRFAVSGLI